MMVSRWLERIASLAAEESGFTLEQLREPSRNRGAVEARRLIALRLREEGASYPEIGSLLKRDHTTIISLVKGRELSQVRVRVA